jgi:hypothetical protein
VALIELQTRMRKRIIAGILGTIAVLASFLPLGYALEDYKSSSLGSLVMCSLGVAALWMGTLFLRFATSAQSAQSRSLAKSALLGIAFFFPGFAFSLPFMILCASLTPTIDGRNYVAAVGVSFCIGVLAAIVCAIILVRKQFIEERSSTTLGLPDRLRRS